MTNPTFVKLTFDSTTYTIPCTSVTPAWNNNTVTSPKANGGSVSEIQTQSFDNPTYTITGAHFTGGAGSITYDALLAMAKLKYDGTNAITLEVRYGLTGSTIDLVGSDGSTTAITVILNSFNFPISTKDTLQGYIPVGNIILQETA